MISTEAGRNVITEVSKSLEDDLLHGLRDADMINIKYHVNICMQISKEKERLELKRNNDTLSFTPLFANTGSPNQKKRKAVPFCN